MKAEVLHSQWMKKSHYFQVCFILYSYFKYKANYYSHHLRAGKYHNKVTQCYCFFLSE